MAMAKTDPKIGPMQGLHPKANAMPINNGKIEIFCNLSKLSFLSKSKKGTFVILDDFLMGRGTYIGNYFLENKDECDSNWEILNIFQGHGGSSICLLERK